MPNPSKMARPGNQNASKGDRAKSRTIAVRVSPELAQCLEARAGGGSIGIQAREDLEGMYGVDESNTNESNF
jgi:hypothetical protein